MTKSHRTYYLLDYGKLNFLVEETIPNIFADFEEKDLCTYVRSCHQKKFVIERTRDLIYLKFVATDFFPKIISPSAGENSGDLA